jgi:phosphatidylglycerophosphate synthase
MARSLDRNNFSRGVVPHPFGAANWVTLLRVVIAVALLGTAIGKKWLGMPMTIELRWLAAAGATLILCLDGLDGFLARRLGQTSAFGARFDMETDAFTMLGLAFLVWAFDQVGGWVLLSGLMRYIFVVGGWRWPVLATPLPPRKRRQTLCVTQMAALILALALPITPLWAGLICLAGLILLGYSFGADLVWLLGQGRVEGKAACQATIP